MDVRELLKELSGGGSGKLVHVQEVEPREAHFAEPESEVPQVLRTMLRKEGIERLYTHQAAAIDAVTDGRDVVIVTATASGKTLCYNLAVARALLEDPASRAMYIFPTKALAQDQYGTLKKWASCMSGDSFQASGRGDGRRGKEPIENEMSAQTGKLSPQAILKPAVYDGDTPSHNRTKIRRSASVVLTNPDMLHVGMLPYHGKWHRFLADLKYIVLDELHSYRGIFGSHVGGVVRRLLRLCEHYGSRPRIICCSATIANPRELAADLTGRDVQLIDDDGSPRGRKYFALLNPPYLDNDNVNRRSANVEAVELLCELVRRRAQTIVFCKARVVAELVHKYAKERLEGEGDLASRIRPYRGGYLPNERREIERELFSGNLLAVASTNALELGIDVGSLDAAILVGFPGTICSTWQQAGRAGRSSEDSLVILVGYNEPVDQYIMRHPGYLFGATHEHGVIDPSNPHILASQLSCACFEKPLSDEDERYFGPLVKQVAEIFADDGEMKPIDGRYYWSTAENPSQKVSLRLISNDTYAIADCSSGGENVIGQVDAISAPELVYPNAIYLHEGRSYLVRELDQDTKIARVEKVDVDYYTQAVLASSCRLGEQREQRKHLGGELFYGPADITWQTAAFRKIKYYTMELIGQAELDLPSQTLPTAAFWQTFDADLLAGLRRRGYNPIEALMGLRNLMLASLPSLAMCDRRDISGMVDSSNLGRPTVVVYDRYPGGLGFSQTGFDVIDTWLDMSRRIVLECPCNGGCPSCVGLANLRPPIHGDPDLGAGYPVPNKNATIRLLGDMQELAAP